MGGAPDIWLVPTLPAVLPSVSSGDPSGGGETGLSWERGRTGVRCHVSSWIPTMSGMTDLAVGSLRVH